MSLGHVVEIDVGVLGLSDDEATHIQSINDCAKRLQALKLSQIDPAASTPYMPKVLWKYLCIRQGIIYRAIELHNATATLLNASNLLGATIMVRTLIELMAFTGDLNERISKGVASKDLGSIDGAIQSTSFSTRWENMPDDAKATNILTLLRRFDRDIMGDEDSAATASMHATLSEFTHPNWVGLMGFFGRLDKETRIQHFSVEPRDKAGVLGTIGAGYISLLAIEYFEKQLAVLAAEVGFISTPTT